MERRQVPGFSPPSSPSPLQDPAPCSPPPSPPRILAPDAARIQRRKKAPEYSDRVYDSLRDMPTPTERKLYAKYLLRKPLVVREAARLLATPIQRPLQMTPEKCVAGWVDVLGGGWICVWGWVRGGGGDVVCVYGGGILLVGVTGWVRGVVGWGDGGGC